MASTIVSADTVERAVHALLKWRAAKAMTEKPQLLEHDEFFYLILTLKKIPQGRTNPFKIPIPHALIDPEVAETCLIIDDRPTSNLTKAAAQEKIKAEGIQVSKVMKLSKLRSDYKAFESKRKLCDSYDMFLADKRVLPVLPKVLGKQFFKKKKIPVGVDLTHKNWKEQIERVYGSALLFLGTGTCSVVRVARVSIGEKEITENVVAAIKGITEVVPRKWGNVRSFHVKMLESLALPIYQTVPDVKLKIEGLKDKVEKELKQVTEKGEVKDEVSAVKKKGPKKGRIHEVKYMDADLDEIIDGDGSDNNAIDDATENYETVAVGKKRKNGGAEREAAAAELNGDKSVKKSSKLKKGRSVEEEKSVVSDKVKKSDGAKKKDSSSVKGGGEIREKGEVKDVVSAVKKKGLKKEKIHEVKYMNADDNNAIDDATEDSEIVAVGKKRKGDSENEAVAELNGDKRVKKPAKLKKGVSEKSVASEKLKKSDSAKKKKDIPSLKGVEDIPIEKEKKKTKKDISTKGVEGINSEKKTKKKKL